MHGRIDALSERIERLIAAWAAARMEACRLRAANRDLIRRLEESEALRRRNEALGSELGDLRVRLEGFETKEEVVKNKLQHIVERIDELEGELRDLEGEEHEIEVEQDESEG